MAVRQSRTSQASSPFDNVTRTVSPGATVAAPRTRGPVGVPAHSVAPAEHGQRAERVGRPATWEAAPTRGAAAHARAELAPARPDVRVRSSRRAVGPRQRGQAPLVCLRAAASPAPAARGRRRASGCESPRHAGRRIATRPESRRTRAGCRQVKRRLGAAHVRAAAPR